MGSALRWNDEVRLIISDVDETIADLYVDASHKMCKELESILDEGKVIFFISGQSVRSVKKRIVDHIPARLRKRIIVGHCSGTEVWGFDEDGNLRTTPFYSLYDASLTKQQKGLWRDVIGRLVSEFSLATYPTMPIPEFKRNAGENPFAIMLEDRGPQITFEVVNGYSLGPVAMEMITSRLLDLPLFSDFRVPIIERAKTLFEEAGLPIAPRLAGVFAIDFVIEGVSKTTAVRYVMENDQVLEYLGLSRGLLDDAKTIEVWGDKFSIRRGGTDRHISEALPKQVRSITFREEDPAEFPAGYNIVVWDGKEHLHDGLIEFLESRRTRS